MKPLLRNGLLAVSLGLTVMVAALAGVSALRKIDTFQGTGFVWSATEQGAARVERVEDPDTGLLAGDYVLLVDGRETGDLGAELESRSARQITLQRDGELLTVTYRRPRLDIDWSYLVLVLIGAAYLGIGSFVMLRSAGPPSRLFHLWCLASAAFFLLTPAFLGLGVGPRDRLDQLIYYGDQLARLLLPPLTLHLFLVFPRPLNALWRGVAGRLRALVPFLYLPAAVLATLELDLAFLDGRLIFGRPLAAAIQLLSRLEMIHLVLYGLLAATALGLRLARQQNPEQRRQSLWLAFGLAGGYLPFAALYLVPYLMGVSTPELLEVAAVLPLALAPLAFAWAILRYKLWDVGVIVRDTVSATLTLLLGVVGFSLVHLAISRGLPADLPLARNLLSFVAGLTIAGLLVPTRSGISTALERFHYRGTFFKRRALEDFARELLYERDLDELCRRLVDELEDGVPLSPVNLYLAAGGGELQPVRPDGRIPRHVADGDLGDTVWERDMRSLSGLQVPSGEMTAEARLFRAGYRYVFPLRVLQHRVGLLVTGYKPEDTPLNSEDVELVCQLLDRASLAIENAQLLDQLHQKLEEVGRLQQYNAGIVESSPAGIVVLDAAERIVSANGAFVRICHVGGTTPEDLVGRPLIEVLPVTPLPRVGDSPVEVSYCEPSGDERYFQLTVSGFAGLPIVAAGGPGEAAGPLRILVIHDVSERVAMENALRERDRLASLGMLAAGVAHEVNTPITGISSYAQMLLADTPEEDPRHEMLRKVERQTFRAARIVNNLLEFSRNRSGERVAFDAVPLVGETLDLLKERLQRRRIRVTWEPPEEPVQVLANEGELQQVLTNLAVNAADAMSSPAGDDGEPAGGSLTLEIEKGRRFARIRVADTGVGIAPERLERIFQPFFSTKLTSGGTGLGLSISYEILRRHGGDLRVESRPGHGSVFVVELPLARPERAPAEDAENQPSEGA
jgi:two-component system, NtrC family, sensor kinase